MDWATAILRWHLDNVAGNIVASIEMAAAVLAIGRPAIRRARRALNRHIADQMADHVTGMHARLDQLAAHLATLADPGGTDPCPPSATPPAPDAASSTTPTCAKPTASTAAETNATAPPAPD